MIRRARRGAVAGPGKPRASGDDPITGAKVTTDASVNPARAGMILIEGREKEHKSSKPRASGYDPEPW